MRSKTISTREKLKREKFLKPIYTFIKVMIGLGIITVVGLTIYVNKEELEFHMHILGWIGYSKVVHALHTLFPNSNFVDV